MALLNQLSGNIINLLLGAGILCLATITAMALFLGRRRKKKERKSIKLRDLSAIWTKDDIHEVHIAELAPLWRDEGILASPTVCSFNFSHARITEFADRHVNRSPWFKNAKLQQDICGQLLLLLDREGDSPSVVNASGDVESSWDSTTYQLLGQTTLLDHTLNVAEEIIKLLKLADACHVIPDAIIAALGHDLGKLKSVQGYMYSLGEHPLASGRPLAEISGFKNLPKKEEIIRAIKLHHKTPDGLLGKTLRKADQQARQQELEEAVERLSAAETAGKEKNTAVNIPDISSDTPLPQPDQPHQKQIASPPADHREGAAWRAQADIYGEEPARSSETKSTTHAAPKMMDISAWFDAYAFLNDLKPYINKVYGRRWMAFSMSDGHVYVQVKVLEEVARKQAERAGVMEIATIANDDPTMRQILFTIVHHLRVEHHDVIDRGLIKDSFFGGYFTVTTKNGKKIKGYYTPFHAEAFGSIAEMENAKPSLLQEFQSVEPHRD